MKATVAGPFISFAVLLGPGGATPRAPSLAGGRQATAPKGRGDLAETPLRAVSIRRSNLPLALSDIAYAYNVPIGVEGSPEDDLLKERHIFVRLESGTLKEVPDTWAADDGVINVLPKGGREPLLKALLETLVGVFASRRTRAASPSGRA